MTGVFSVTLLVSALIVTGPSDAQAPTPSTRTAPEAPSAEATVRRFVDAFNQHNVAAMAVLVSDDLQWLTVSGNALSVEADGRAALEKSMAGYFRSCPSCRSELESVMVAGSYVTLYERAMWDTKGGPRAQRSLAVYEVRDGLIRRAWYYPAEK